MKVIVIIRKQRLCPYTTTMEHTEVRDSPYITNFDLVPPSPTRSHNLEFDHTSPFEANFANNALTSPTFPHSPSYNGSYYNSPYSQHSELAELDFLTDFPSAPGSGINPEYETSEYDAPNSSGNGQGNSLLMFSSDTDYMSPPYSGGAGDVHRGRAGSPFDHGSPGSSAGGDDNNGATHGRHSRASSVASHHNPHLQSPSPQPQGLNYSPQPNFHPSPRLDVVNSFGNMSVHTPNWGAQSLPQGGHSPNVQSQGLPQGSQKPLSPPRLSMPPSMAFESESTAVPTINAPDEGDGHDNNGNGGLRSAGNGPGGPSFNIVPATPVSGGVSHARQGVQFQQSLGTLPQGKSEYTVIFIFRSHPSLSQVLRLVRLKNTSNPSLSKIRDILHLSLPLSRLLTFPRPLMTIFSRTTIKSSSDATLIHGLALREDLATTTPGKINSV
ncbi:hypothetical protein CPB83DRAFT_417700 [Crepidotus variabilis]|uniref:Uncharacterized protein n=1 Tax=Crepidotus variabilis TaxID=179855 RepID=A0A9P6ERZ6_9AGAR|nr:hypothetical protein CPB83DRAFT_417700 [Crepidotus variabilis]